VLVRIHVASCSPGGARLRNDGNNMVIRGATLKIDWRADVKHRGRGRVVVARKLVSVRRMGLHGLAADASGA
jgi:hypothetical protein